MVYEMIESAECETYRPSTWARRQRDSDRRLRDSEAPGVQLAGLSDARRRAAYPGLSVPHITSFGIRRAAGLCLVGKKTVKMKTTQYFIHLAHMGRTPTLTTQSLL